MGTAGVASGILRNMDGVGGVGTAAKLLKKAVEADKSLVAKLLPPAPPVPGRLDIRA